MRSVSVWKAFDLWQNFPLTYPELAKQPSGRLSTASRLADGWRSEEEDEIGEDASLFLRAAM